MTSWGEQRVCYFSSDGCATPFEGCIFSVGDVVFQKSYDVIEDFNYDPGCISLVQDGFLKIISDDEEVKAQAPVTTKKTASDVDVRKIVVDGTPRQLYDLLKSATPALKDLIVETAIKNNVVDPAKRNFIKAVTGVDILNALAITQDTITPTKG